MVYVICVTEECNYTPASRFGLPSIGNRANGFANLCLYIRTFLLAGTLYNIKCVAVLLIHPRKVTQIYLCMFGNLFSVVCVCRYQHSRQLVVALNRFTDTRADLPQNWEKKLNREGKVCLAANPGLRHWFLHVSLSVPLLCFVYMCQTAQL